MELILFLTSGIGIFALVGGAAYFGSKYLKKKVAEGLDELDQK
jgi:hypothetical protein